MISATTANYHRALYIALRKAIRDNEDYPSTEYILFGLLVTKNCQAQKVLKELGINKAKLYQELSCRLTKNSIRRKDEVSWSPRALRIFYLAPDEAKKIGSQKIGTEHLLLALIREQDGLAGRILIKLGINLEITYETLKKLKPPEVV